MGILSGLAQLERLGCPVVPRADGKVELTNGDRLPANGKAWLRAHMAGVKYAVLNEAQYLERLVGMGADAWADDWEERYFEKYGEPPLTELEGM